MDGVYKNFSVYEQGTESLSARTLTSVSFSNTTLQIPLIAIRPSTSGFVSVFGYTTSGDEWSGFKVMSDSDLDVDWKAYLAHPQAEAASHGLIVKNDKGEYVFDSAREYFSIFDVEKNISIAIAAPDATSGGYQDITHSGISNPYYVLAPLGWWERRYVMPYQGPVYFFRTGIKKLSSTSVRVGWTYCYEGVTNYADSFGYNPDYNLIILENR